MKDDPTNLDLLHDLVLPPAVPWWPPTAGWWLLMLAAATGLAVMATRWIFRWQADRYRREALAALAADDLTAAAIPALLKRVAVTAWPRERTASLNGAQWLEFLDRSSGMDVFRKGPGAVLESVSYDDGSIADVDELKRLAGEWIRNHRRELAP